MDQAHKYSSGVGLAENRFPSHVLNSGGIRAATKTQRGLLCRYEDQGTGGQKAQSSTSLRQLGTSQQLDLCVMTDPDASSDPIRQ